MSLSTFCKLKFSLKTGARDQTATNWFLDDQVRFLQVAVKATTLDERYLHFDYNSVIFLHICISDEVVASSDLQLSKQQNREKKGMVFFWFYRFKVIVNVYVAAIIAAEVIRAINTLMITNQLSFILTVPRCRRRKRLHRQNPEAQSLASGLLWIALNTVGTWTLIHVWLSLHTVRSAVALLDVLKWIFMSF